MTAARKALEDDPFPRAPRLEPLRAALAKLDPSFALRAVPVFTPPLSTAPPRAHGGQRAMRVAVVALLIGWSATPAAAENDRVSAAAAAERWCENFTLANTQVLSALTLNDVPLTTFCNCMSRQMVDGSSDQDLGLYMSTGRFPPTMGNLSGPSAQLCFLLLTR
jgi:hypothetical protein